MPLCGEMAARTTGKSERDRPAQRCRELALGNKLANRIAGSNEQAKPTQDRAPSGSVAYVAVSGRRFVARVFEWPPVFRERRD